MKRLLGILDHPGQASQTKRLGKECATRIQARDRLRGERAMARWRQWSDGLKPVVKAPLLNEVLPELDRDRWKAFLDRAQLDALAWDLVNHLKRSWEQLTVNEQKAQAGRVQKIVDQLLERFEDLAYFEASLAPMGEALRETERESKRDRLKEELAALERNRDWPGMKDLLDGERPLGLGEASFFLEKRRLVSKGLDWQKIYQKVLAQMAPESLDLCSPPAAEDLRRLVEENEPWAQENQMPAFKGKWEQMVAWLLKQFNREDRSAAVTLAGFNDWHRNLHLGVPNPPNPLPQDWFRCRQRLENSVLEQQRRQLERRLPEVSSLEQLTGLIEKAEQDLDELQIDVSEARGDWSRKLKTDVDRLRNLKIQLENLARVTNPFQFKLDPAHGQALDRQEKNGGNWKLVDEVRGRFEELKRIQVTVENLCRYLSDRFEEGRGLSRGLLMGRETCELRIDGIETLQIEVDNLAAEIVDVEVLPVMGDWLRIAAELLVAGTSQLRGERESRIGPYANLERWWRWTEAGEVLTAELETLKSAPAATETALQPFLEWLARHRHGDFLICRNLQKKFATGIGAVKRGIQDHLAATLDDLEDRLLPAYPPPGREELQACGHILELLRSEREQKAEELRAFPELFMPFSHRLIHLDSLRRILALFDQNQLDQAEAKIEGEIANPRLKQQLSACLYFYRHLERAAWHENNWLKFFKTFGSAVLSEKAEDHPSYRTLTGAYHQGLCDHLKQLDRLHLAEHAANIRDYGNSQEILPYLNLALGGDKSVFLTAIRANFNESLFCSLLAFLIHHRLWQLYLNLYGECKREQKYFIDPEQTVRIQLERDLAELVDRFRRGRLTEAHLVRLAEQIPADVSFGEISETVNNLRQLHGIYQHIESRLRAFQSQDIWSRDALKADLESLRKECERFGGDQAAVGRNRQWEPQLEALSELYSQGRVLLELFAVPPYSCGPREVNIDLLEGYDVKAENHYSQLLSRFLELLLEAWQRFETAASRHEASAVIAANFAAYHLPRFEQKWRSLGFYDLYRNTGKAEPKTLTTFFEMWENIRDNHKNFKQREREGGDLTRIQPEHVLDEHIKQTLSRYRHDP